MGKKQEVSTAHVYRTAAEVDVGRDIAAIFDRSSDSTEARLETFPRYVRRQHLKRFLAMYELFKRVLPVKGSVVECGVYRGFGLMSWAKLSTILEPENLTRRIYGFRHLRWIPFDRRGGSEPVREEHPSEISPRDPMTNCSSSSRNTIGIDSWDTFPKCELVRGDITRTVPAFLKDNPHLIVSLLFIDCDLFEPTRAALETFVPRMPKGAILAFDELDNPIWPGETMAVLESLGIKSLRLQRLDWDPYIAFAEIE